MNTVFKGQNSIRYFRSKIWNSIPGELRGESHIDFRTQCVIMTDGALTNDVLKFRKIIEFQSSEFS